MALSGRSQGEGQYRSSTARVHLAYETGHSWCVLKTDGIELDGRWYTVVKEHGSFSLVGMYSKRASAKWIHSRMPLHAELFMPIDQTMTAKDIEGATYCRDNGTAWTDFAHAAPAEHHEFARFCVNQALAEVQPILNDRTERYMVATTDGPIQVAARAEFQAWRAFAVQVQEFAEKYALAEPLGHWERNRDLHHVRNIIGRAMAGTLNKWGAARADTSEHNYYQKVRNEASKMSLALQQAPSATIKTWPTHRAEVAAAEAAKKAEEAAKKAKEAQEEE